jgi:nicotinamide riboside kinase
MTIAEAAEISTQRYGQSYFLTHGWTDSEYKRERARLIRLRGFQNPVPHESFPDDLLREVPEEETRTEFFR